MTTLRDYLKAGDPLTVDAILTAEEVTTLRRTVLTAEACDDRRAWGLVAVLATVLAGVVVGGTWLSRSADYIAPARVARTEPAQALPVPAPARQQLQFSTSGGTRVFWVFNPELELR